MKKSLLALAALGAFAGAASAQSSVTLFGIVDESINYTDNAGQKTYTLAANQLNSNRLGFRGVEDLGGGLQAGFWLEAGMDNATGSVGGGSGNVANGDSTSSQIFNRRSTVSLMGKWGEVRLGRDYTPTFWNTVFFDVNGANGLGNGDNVVDGSLGSGATTFARANNSIGYFLPSGLGGLYGQAMYAFGQSPTGTSGNKYQGGRLGWASGPFDVAIAYSETERGAAGVGSTDKFKVFNIGGSWNFQVAKVYFFYNENKWSSAKQDVYELSVGVPIGAGEFRASYADADRKGTNPNILPNPSIDQNDAKLWSIEYIYNLSKRTALYTTYGEIHNDGASRFSVLPGSPADARLSGGNSKGFNVGMRHSF